MIAFLIGSSEDSTSDFLMYVKRTEMSYLNGQEVRFSMSLHNVNILRLS
jgi:hypothetical protein